MKTNRSILLVDDDSDILSQLKTLLEIEGYKVFLTDNSKEALKVFNQELPDAVATDLMMEEMDSGFMLTYQIKKTEHGRKIPVILMTSAAYVTGFKFDAYTSEEKEWLKCDAVLNKPISVEELIQKIDQYYEVAGK
jgi:two-component system alkaline phosphatase synthesis response regulator PhoP